MLYRQFSILFRLPNTLPAFLAEQRLPDLVLSYVLVMAVKPNALQLKLLVCFLVKLGFLEFSLRSLQCVCGARTAYRIIIISIIIIIILVVPEVSLNQKFLLFFLKINSDTGIAHSGLN